MAAVLQMFFLIILIRCLRTFFRLRIGFNFSIGLQVLGKTSSGHSVELALQHLGSVKQKQTDLRGI